MFKQRLLSSSIAMATAVGGVQAVAQVQGEQALEEVVVTGVRASLEKGLDIKRDSYQVVDSIVAEDIGKFPDNNVVEALQRVSGVQVTDRGAGEVNTVSIRGLTDVTTTINGRQIFTSSGRAVALADVPASLLKGVNVYKTRSASQLESGIAGQIDIRTQRPFDFDGSKVVVAGRGIYQEQADSTDPNLSGLFSNRWETSAGEFGALVNVSYAETNYRDQNVAPGAIIPFATEDAPANLNPYQPIRSVYTANGPEPWAVDPEYWGVQNWTPGLEAGLPNQPGSTVTVGGEEAEYMLSRDAIFENDLTGTRERPAANISLQWAPNERSEYLFEAFYNGYRNESFNTLNFSYVDFWGDASGLPNGGEFDYYEGTNVVKSREVAEAYGFTSGDLTKSETDSFVYALGGNWDITDNFRLESEVYYQKSEYEDSFIAMQAFRSAYGVGVDFNSGNGMPSWVYYDNPETTDVDESDLTDASQWTTSNFYDNGASSEGDALTFDLDGELDLNEGAIHTLRFGLRHDVRGASEASRDQNNEAPENYREMPLDSIDGLASVGSGFFDGRADIPTAWASTDGYYLSANADEIREIYGLPTESMRKTFEVEEATTSVYAEADFDTELAGKVVDGQFGLRYVTADTDMDFYDFDEDTDTGSKSSASASSSKLLPSLVTRLHITDDLIARFAYTETLRRPNFDQLNAFTYYQAAVTDTELGTATSGNPELEPVESQNYDLSLEWYFSDSSALYGTLFRRDVDGFVHDSARVVDYEGDTYVLTQPANTSNGVLEGLELGLTYFPDNLPEMLDGFGIQASYTALDSEQEIPVYDGQGEKTGMTDTPMFGVSDSSYSVVFAYDKNKLDMRLSYVWRDDFLYDYEARSFANPLGIYNDAETSVDFQASYDVTDNLLVTFDATNLTDEEYQNYYENQDIYNLNTAIYSRTFALGARYSF
ncbi:TonB-dependent receptor [Microbulbifer halophilus]|uniref:TonB-dependent receptor n=1 Tax=Microbulbifer halophilus TaxID=453963 RepID=A0ABW5EHM8_9GAMM|nr:TonB-dependent receptor [Microbulbifer halophilus]MCW8126296.1 TonB-dependent receptor [Microbulbifer halophilus]